jgi:hypothetical protein
MTESQSLREVLFAAVDNVNNKFVFDGLPHELERFVPLVEIRYVGSDYAVYFFGHCMWDSDNDPRFGWEMSVEAMEKHLIKSIDDIRRVLNHVTSSIGSVI